MKTNFNFTKEEKNRVLEMHDKYKKSPKLISEQTLTGVELLKKAREKGCKIAVGGVLKSAPGKPDVLFKKADYDSKNGYFKVGDELYVKSDYTFDVVKRKADGSVESVIKGKTWACKALAPDPSAGNDPDYEIKKAKEEGWKTYEELKSANVDPSTIDVQYEKKVIGNTTLYKYKFADVQVNTDLSTAELNQQQKAFVDKWAAAGYLFNVPLADRETLTPYKPEDLGAPAGLFKPGAMFYYDPKSVTKKTRKGESDLEDILTSQTPSRAACRDYTKDFFQAWKTRTKIPGGRMVDLRTMVEKCARTYKGKWGLVGGNKLDDMIDILSGSKEGGPSSYSSDKDFRLNLN